MFHIELRPLHDVFNHGELLELRRKLKADISDSTADVERIVDDDALAEGVLEELLDRLEAHDLRADFYVPAKLVGAVDTSMGRVASLSELVDKLQQVGSELSEDNDEKDEDEDDGDAEDDDDSSSEPDICWLCTTLQREAKRALKHKLLLVITLT